MIVAGFGFRGAVTVESLRAALAATDQAGVEILAAPSDKALALAFQKFAKSMGLPVLEISADMMQATDTITHSGHSLTHRGTGSVAEACALAAAGPQAELVTHRHVSPDRLATCAIAIGARP